MIRYNYNTAITDVSPVEQDVKSGFDSDPIMGRTGSLYVNFLYQDNGVRLFVSSKALGAVKDDSVPGLGTNYHIGFGN